MKNKKRIFIVTIIVFIIAIIGLVSYNILTDSNKITSSEKKWINDNINKIQNINVINDVDIFGNTGSGIFYEFINDFERDYKLQLNPVTFNYGENPSGLTLGVKTSLKKDDSVFFEGHYVLVSRKDEIVQNYNSFAGKKIGVVKDEIAYISDYLTNVSGINLTGYENKEVLLEEMSKGENIDYIIVPLTLYLDEILRNDYYIVNHMSDVKLYYVISSSNDTLSTIVNKYFNTWKEDNLNSYYKREKFKLFAEALGITDTEIDALKSVTYKYGFINNSPYEVLMSGNYGGIVAMYLYDFSEFCDVDFNFKKYNNLSKFKQAINNKEIDLYFNYYNMSNNYYDVSSKILVSYSVIAKKENNVVINSVKGLVGNEVYVDENSLIANYLSNIDGINIKTYKDDKDLKRLNKKDVIIVIDKNIFNLYREKELSNYSERYSDVLNSVYDFKSKNNSAFYKLFSKYVMAKDSNEMINRGMYSHSMTVKTGGVLASVAKYILLTLAVFAIIIIIFYKSSKRIKVAKKIRREDRLKFIDQLTTLKNRNYLNEYINNWNNNTIYPQTMIVIDLNNIQFINDTLGYEEGDRQIKAAANILIKTQLDNSDVMRTDGNEFLIYLVGYTQKQVTNYIHKLNKEFKKLPYEYGAEFGYSIINDNIKTIEDAILEATDEMKGQKKKIEDENAR